MMSASSSSRGIQCLVRRAAKSPAAPLRSFSSTVQRSTKTSTASPLTTQRLVSKTTRTPQPISSTGSLRLFSSSADRHGKNRIYTPCRRPDELQSYIDASTSSRIPLVTLWTASYCPSCKYVAPLVHSLITHGVGESTTTSVNYCEVEFDSKDIQETSLPMDYMITSLPTLVTFDRGEVISETKVTDVKLLRDEAFLTPWIENEAKRKGEGTGTGGVGGSLFGGLFGNTKH